MEKRERAARGERGRGNKLPTSTSKKKNKKLLGKDEESGKDPAIEFVDQMKMMGDVHCVSLSRVHMRASEHEPLDILISPFLFKYLEDFDHDPSIGEEDPLPDQPSIPTGSVKELGLAYRRLFQIFDETDFIPPISTTFPFSNERIRSFEHVTILPGVLHHEMFKPALPEDLRDDQSRWINDPDNFLKVPLTKEGSNHLFLLLGSDSCVHHPSNMCRSMVNNALIYYSLLSKLGFTWDNIHHSLVTLLPQPPQENDPPLLNRVLRMITIMASRKTRIKLSEEALPDVFISSTPVDYTHEDYQSIEGMVGWSFSSLDGEEKEQCPSPSVSPSSSSEEEEEGEEEEGEKGTTPRRVKKTNADILEDILALPLSADSSEDEATWENTGDFDTWSEDEEE